MTELDALELISSTFVTAWTTAQPTVPFALRNEALPTADSFVLCTAMITSGKMTTQGPRGTRRIERNGWVQIKTWVLAGGGAAPSARLADAARQIFEGADLPPPTQNDETINFGAALTTDPVTDGRWEMQVVRVPFRLAQRR